MKLSDAFVNANQKDRKLPDWRRNQIVALIIYITHYATDVAAGYARRRTDLIAQAIRNLTELHVWIMYCAASEENAKRFYEDSICDMKELIEALQKIYTKVNASPNLQLETALSGLRSDAPTLGVQYFDRPYIRLANAAESLGWSEIHSPFYKVISKFSHPTSFTLATAFAKPDQAILDALYQGGPSIAHTCLGELEKFLSALYPGLRL